MKVFDLSKELLNQIMVEDKTFSDALKEKFSADPLIRPLRADVAALVGCVMRHNILLTYLLKDAEGIDDSSRIPAMLAIANAYFVKKHDIAEVDAWLKPLVPETVYAKTIELIAKKDDPESFIPANIDRNSLQYLSLRFNTPEWSLKVIKHFGVSNTFKVLRKNNRLPQQYVRVRTSRISVEEVLKDQDFSKTSVEGVLAYKGKLPLRKNGFFIKGDVFSIKPAIKAVLDKFQKTSDGAEVMVFNANNDDALSLEILESYGPRIGVNVGVYDYNSHPAIAKAIKDMGLRTVNYFEGQPDSIESAISHPQDLVVAYANSTNFDLVREQPDYLFHFKREQMDEIIQKQSELLEGVSKFVGDQSDLLYVISTISKKEGHGQVADFLKNHPEFTLEEENQLFPFDEYDSCLFYALLHKGMPVAKATTPMTELKGEGATGVSMASAKEAQ